MRFIHMLGIAAVLALAAAPSMSDTLQLENAVGPAADGPPRGSSMKEVERLLGPPQDRRGPVGEPPITVWTYPTFNVYFEYDKVLHSVTRATAKQ